MAVTAPFSVLVVSCAFLTVSTFTTITTTPITPETSPCPALCVCSNNNLTVDCSNRGFFRLPGLAGHVTHLDLSGNLLGPMINGSFPHLRHLQQVDLSGNGLLRLQLCTFTGLLHLHKVDLHNNHLRSLPTGLLADNGGMEVLDLSHNDLDFLPDLLLHSVPLLKVLNVSHNEVTLLKLGLRFQVLTQLTILDLSHNPFTNASRDAFEMAETWDHRVHRKLDLSFCQLQNIHPQALSAIPGLRDLSLAGNSLLSFSQVADVLKNLQTSGLETVNLSNMSIIDPGLFSEVRLMALKELDLSGNLIATVPNNTFGNIRSLQKLDISRNLLTALDAGFDDLVNLVKLNISRCRLVSFKGNPVERMHHLTVLDLSHNQLLEPADVDLSALHKLQVLDMSFNTLRSVVLPGNTSNIVFLNFASNALSTLSSMPNMKNLRYFSCHDNNLQSLSAFLFTEATLILVANFSNNDLASIDHRAFLPTSPEVIDLSHNFLTDTHFFSWTTTKEIYLQDNKLNNLDQQTFYGMDRMQVLDLGNNNLTVIHEETFKYLSNLTTLRISNNSVQMSNFFQLFHSMESLQNLDLSFNLIKEMNATSLQPLVSLESLSLRMNKMRVIPVQLFNKLDHLVEVDISGNPFDCGCDLLTLQQWLRNTKVKIIQRFDLNFTNMCASPPEHRGKLVTLYSVHQFQCNTKMLYMIIFGSVGGLGITAGIISSLVFHYYIKRRKPQPLRHRHVKNKVKDKHSGHTDKKRIDLVRVSKPKDPYNKEELINGWVASRQFTAVKKNSDSQSDKRNRQMPPRPPWPEQLHERSKRTEKERKELHRKMVDNQPPRPQRRDHRLRSISEMLPLRYPHVRTSRVHSLMPVWDEHYHQKYSPMPINVKRLPDRRGDAETYPTWSAPYASRLMYSRDTGHYFTLPCPTPWPHYPPYGPNYPYRTKRSEEEEIHRIRQVRALPYPPREHDLNHRHLRTLDTYHQNPSYDSYLAHHHRDYENLRNYQQESHRGLQEVRVVPESSHNLQPHSKEHDNGSHIQDRSRSNDERERQETEKRHSAKEPGQPMKQCISDVQIHRRNSEYLNAMDNPIGPKAASSPLLSEDKISDWL